MADRGARRAPSRRALSFLVAALLCAPAGARAEAETEPSPQPGEAVTAPATVQGLVETTVDQVARLVADLPRSRLDAVAPLVAELPGGTAGRRSLATLVRQLVAAGLSRRLELRSVRSVEASADGRWATEPAARSAAAAEGYELLLWARLSVEQNHLVLEGTVYLTDRHLWRDMATPERQLLGQVFARRRVNAEIRHYLGPPEGGGDVTVREIPLGRPGYLDLAAADLDGDDLTEIVLLRRSVVEIRHLVASRLEPVARFPLADVPPAATRSRDPVGTVVVGPAAADGSRDLAVRTSDHDRGLLLRFDGQSVTARGELSDFPLRWGREELECATLPPGRNAFQTAPAPCSAVAAERAVSAYHDLGESRIEQPRGPAGFAAAKTLADGRVALRWDERPVATIRRYGTAVAVTDLDDDGIAEVLLSSDREPGRGDELFLLRLAADGEPPRRESLGPLDGSVWAAAAGDADDDGLREILAIAESGGSARLVVIE